MANVVCPQRILREAIDLLNSIAPKSEDEAERIDNNIQELEFLIKVLPNSVAEDESHL
jgi:hypothetical protein